MVCPWPFMASMDSTVVAAAKPSESGKSFAHTLSGSGSGDSFLSKIPPKVVMGNSVRVKISQAAYESGLAACQCNLHGRLTLHKGDSPLTTQALKVKLNNIWPHLRNWNLIPLGKGFYEFNFGSIEDMRSIWALGVVNLKPGFLRFSCWTKDFAPKAQAQTHAQVWIRLMQLPQEYWGKQTIFEIASGLGSPLTIDEATQQRRFGIFARVLVDIDLSDKMFESVIVEREGHALSIEVQYEKHPLFCTHCRNLGHRIQTCSKLNADTSANVHPKAHNVNNKAQLKNDVNNKKNDDAFVHKTIHTSQNAVGKNPASNHVQPDISEPVHESIIEVEDGEVPQYKVTNLFTSVDTLGKQNIGCSAKLSMHNSFELLDNDCELVAGEAKQNDMEIRHITKDKVSSINTNVDDIPLERENLSHITNLEDPGNLDEGTSEPEILCSSTPLLDPNNGRQSFPIVGPSPLAQSSKTGRQIFPSATSASFCQALDPDLNETCILQPIVTPITTYEQLGPDKSKVKIPSSSKNLSAAAIKSVKLLSKFWGDEINEEPATDSTMDQDTDTESHRSLFESHSNIDKYLAKNVEPASTIKPGRKSKSTTNLVGTSSVRITTGSDDDKNDKSFTPYVSNRQKKKNKLQSPRESENECIQTRAKSGISKAYKS